MTLLSEASPGLLTALRQPHPASYICLLGYLYNHLRKFGLLMHVGNGDVASKTEAMYFPPPRAEYTEADTTRIDVLDTSGVPVGFVDFTKEFKYLGSIVHYSPSSEADVDKRIKSATAAFGALKNVFTNKHLDLKLKV